MQCCSTCYRFLGLFIATMFAGAMLLTVSCEKENDSKPGDSDLHVVEGDTGHDHDNGHEDHTGHDHAPGEGHDDDADDSHSTLSDTSDTQQITFDGLSTQVPSSWESQRPRNDMRAVQMRVPGEGDAGDASFVAFSSIGGSVNQNISRWIGQFASEDDRHLSPDIEEIKVGDVDVTIVTINGDYDGGSMSPDDTGSNRTMIQAIVIQPFGDQTFLRLLGPSETVEANREAFDRMISGIR